MTIIFYLFYLLHMEIEAFGLLSDIHWWWWWWEGISLLSGKVFGEGHWAEPLHTVFFAGNFL